MMKEGMSKKAINRIILIGNGFDLAHRLKTSYKDFIDDYWEKIKINIPESTTGRYYDESNTLAFIYKYEDQNIKIQSGSPFTSLSRNQNKDIKGYAWFKTLEESISIQYKNIFLKNISEKQLKNWVDIEYEYYLALNVCLESALENEKKGSIQRSMSVATSGNPKNKWKDGIEQLNKEFSAIQESLVEYLKGQKATEKNHKIEECIFSNLNGNLLFLNFNYTDTTKLYFQEHKTHEIIHIHGELDNPDNPIIFGYGDEMDKKSGLIEDKNEKDYLVNNKSIRYLQTGNYQKMLAFIEDDEYEIFVMGHSCGISDRTLLNTLFEHEYCKKIKPFYYEKDGKDNYEDIVINIYRNFKDKKLCRARVVSKPNCEPLPQLEKNVETNLFS